MFKVPRALKDRKTKLTKEEQDKIVFNCMMGSDKPTKHNSG